MAALKVDVGGVAARTESEGRPAPYLVTTGHSRSQNGVATLAFARWSMLRRCPMDCRVEPGNDENVMSPFY